MTPIATSGSAGSGLMAEPTRLRSVVGGTGFLHRGSLALLIPTSLLTSLLSRDMTGGRGLLGWTAANLLAFLACWGLVALADRTVFRRRAQHAVRVPAVVGFGALLGALKGVATDLSGVGLGLITLTWSATLWRGVGTAALGAVAVPAVAALHVAVERYRTEHAVLVAQQLAGLDAPGPTQGTAPDRVLAPLAASLRSALADAPTAAAATTIRALVDERLRPAMEAMWVEGGRVHQRLDVRSLLGLAVTRNPYPVRGVAAAYALSVLPTSVELTGAGIGTLRTLVAGATLAATLLLARTVRPRSGPAVTGALHLVATVAMATAVQIIQWDRLLGGMPAPSTPSLWVTVGVWIAALVVVGGAVAIALRERSAVHAELLLAVGPEMLRTIALQDQDRMLAQRVATRLHADVQGRMLAAARRIEREGHAPASVAQELRALDELLGDLPDLARSDRSAGLRTELERLVARWRGFIDVGLSPGTDAAIEVLRGAPDLEERVAQIVGEAVANAVRHGLARTATVTLDVGEDGVAVTVVDDGIGPRDGAPGLGSAYYAAASAGDWSLAAGEDGGAVLRVRVTG